MIGAIHIARASYFFSLWVVVKRADVLPFWNDFSYTRHPMPPHAHQTGIEWPFLLEICNFPSSLSSNSIITTFDELIYTYLAAKRKNASQRFTNLTVNGWQTYFTGATETRAGPSAHITVDSFTLASFFLITQRTPATFSFYLKYNLAARAHCTARNKINWTIVQKRPG